VAYPVRVPGNELLVPLRSNGSGLLAGTHVGAVRRRLKFASICFERIFLEAGVYRLQAGPGGPSAFLELPPHREEPRWQTPAQRRAARSTSFSLSIRREITPGVPAPVMHTALASETEASWAATLYPLIHELPADTNWVEFTGTRDPAGGLRRLSDG
jgi:hypothetical protein